MRDGVAIEVVERKKVSTYPESVGPLGKIGCARGGSWWTLVGAETRLPEPAGPCTGETKDAVDEETC